MTTKMHYQELNFADYCILLAKAKLKKIFLCANKFSAEEKKKKKKKIPIWPVSRGLGEELIWWTICLHLQAPFRMRPSLPHIKVWTHTSEKGWGYQSSGQVNSNLSANSTSTWKKWWFQALHRTPYLHPGDMHALHHEQCNSSTVSFLPRNSVFLHLLETTGNSISKIYRFHVYIRT